MLLISIAATVTFSIFPLLISAFPVTASISSPSLAKAHNIYLVTCTQRRSDKNFTAVAYFRKPINTTASDPDDVPEPNKSAVVSEPPEPWEGTRWNITVWREKVFTADISVEAKTLAKGNIAGSVSLGKEPYACFKDTETAIRIRDGDLKGKCIADYWCAGLGNGKDNGGKDDDGL